MNAADALAPMVDDFVDDVTEALLSATAGLTTASGDSEGVSALRSGVILEAYNLCVAFIDVDGRHTDSELWALTGTFGSRLSDTQLSGATPAVLRSSTLLAGKSTWIEKYSTTFDILVTADSNDGGRRSMAYYRRAMDLAHLIASIDEITAQAELVAIAAYRTLLLDHMRARLGHVPFSGYEAPSGPSGSTRHRAAIDDLPTARTNDRPPAQIDESAKPVATAAPQEPESEPDEPVDPPPRPLEDVLAELEELVGLDEVKAEVRLVTDLLRVQQLRKERDLPVIDTTLHLVFVGNPGTGKTTVGRLLAEIYRSVGALERGHLVETDRSGLVAGYVGQTAPLVVAAFDKADGGMLFIDEAYTLVRGGENDFGREAVDQMVKLMEDRRDRIAVIVAGYPAEMAQLINANPGLKSRFSKTINFPDYTTGELIGIFNLIAGKKCYHLNEDSEVRLRAVIDAEPREKGFGNGRFVRNQFEAAIGRHATRVSKVDSPTDEDLQLLLDDDFGPAPPADVTSVEASA